MIFVLAYPEFEAAPAERLHRFRALHEPRRAERVPPHLTLMFGVKTAHLRTVTRLVETAAGRTPPFAVAFDAPRIEFDPFEATHKIVLSCTEGREAATALHRRLYDGPHCADLSPDHPFRPHMTIAAHRDRAEAEQVDVAPAADLPLVGAVRALELVRLDDDVLTSLRSAPLQGRRRACPPAAAE